MFRQRDHHPVDPRKAVLEILQNIAKKDGITTGKRIAYLNSLVGILRGNIANREKNPKQFLGFEVQDICICLRVCLFQEAAVTRTAVLRVFRYLIANEYDLQAILATDVPTLVVRSMDIVLDNAGERVQAIRLCQKFISIPSGAQLFPVSVIRVLVAIAFDGLFEKDKLHRGSLSILCQLAVLVPNTFIDCGGVRVLLHNLSCCACPMVLEALVASLLYLLNICDTRTKAKITLHSLIAPLSDIHFNLGGKDFGNSEQDEREIGYNSSQKAIAAVLHSWNGMLHFCQTPKSGLRALIEALYIEQLEIRKTILDLISDIVGLKFPKWTDDVSVALSTLDPSQAEDSWSLQEGFVAEEASVVLPHLATATPNITANHTALLMLCFVRDGLFDALVEVIITSDTFISVRATVLLGELLSLADRLIPTECLDISQSIPSLIKLALSPALLNTINLGSRVSTPTLVTAAEHLKQQRAMEAVTVLGTLHRIKATAHVPSSIFLQMQVARAGISKNQVCFQDRLGEVQLSRTLRKNLEGNPSKLLKETFVLSLKNPFMWHWETICSILKWRPERFKKIDDSSWRSFLRKLVDFYKPSTNLFARTELGGEDATLFVKAGCSFVELLSEEVQSFGSTLLLTELLEDLVVQLDNLLLHIDNPNDAQWSPSRLETTLSQAYFLFIGKLTETTSGFRFLEQVDIPKKLVQLVNKTQHEHYVKLVISSLSYSKLTTLQPHCEDFSRMLMKSALKSLFIPCRIYATKFLKVLVRVKPPEFSKWGIELLVQQLDDIEPRVALQALEVLEEAIHDKMFLESLIALRPTLTHLGDRGLLLLICFLSLPSGFKYLNEANFLKIEIEKWRTSYNKRYVELVEILARDSISSLRRGEDGLYPARKSRNKEHIRLADLYFPPHLYGQLAKHKSGLDMLKEFGGLDHLIQIVVQRKCKTEVEIADLKGALWALSHLSVAEEALPLLQDSNVLHVMITLASDCPVLSVRHTVFHCICLISSTKLGADCLKRHDWHAMPRTHHEIYPIWEAILNPNFISDSVVLDLDRSPAEPSESDSVIFRQVEPDQSSLVIPGFSPDEWENSELPVPSSSDTIFELQEPGVSLTKQNPSEAPIQKLPNTDNNMTKVDPTLPLRDKIRNGDSNAKDLMKIVCSERNVGKLGEINKDFRNPRSETGQNDWQSKNTISEGIVFQEVVEAENDSSMKTRIAKQKSLEFNNCSMMVTSTSATIPGTLGSPSSLMPSSLPDIHPSSLPSENAPPTYIEHVRSTPQHRMDSTNHFKQSSPANIPNKSDPEVYKPSPVQHLHHRMSLRLKPGNSLDKTFVLSPRDLFNESKLRRLGTSMTSLSTQSVRSHTEGEYTKGPCFMGLCLPKHTDMLMQVKQESPDPDRSFCFSPVELPARGTLVYEADPEPQAEGQPTEIYLDAKNVIIREILRLVTNLISNVGTHFTEQSLLSLKQRYTKTFQSIEAYSELCILLSQHNIRLTTRRFLQELFFDVSFENYYDEANVVAQKLKDVNHTDSKNLSKTSIPITETDLTKNLT